MLNIVVLTVEMQSLKRVTISSVIGFIEMSLDSKCMFYSEDSCVDC